MLDGGENDCWRVWVEGCGDSWGLVFVVGADNKLMLYSGELEKDAHSKSIIFWGTVNGVIGYCLFTIFGCVQELAKLHLTNSRLAHQLSNFAFAIARFTFEHLPNNKFC